MRTFTKSLFFFLTILPTFVFSQTDSVSKNDTALYTLTEQPPVFEGGYDAMATFMRDNFVYPKKERKANITGTCYVSFTVEKDGTITDIQVMRGVKNGKGCDEEAVRLVSTMPNWVPGKQNGKLVRTRLALPIKFSLR